MFVVICYDIANDRRRYRIERAISDYGYRVQKSVFEAHISERALVELREKLCSLMSPAEDTIRYYTLCKNCINAVEADGIGIAPDEDEEHTIVV